MARLIESSHAHTGYFIVFDLQLLISFFSFFRTVCHHDIDLDKEWLPLCEGQSELYAITIQTSIT